MSHLAVPALTLSPVVHHGLPGPPSCATHCSGRHDTEGWLRCRVCGSTPYQIVLHERRDQEGHYFYTLKPVNGGPDVMPIEAIPVRCCGMPLGRTR